MTRAMFLPVLRCARRHCRAAYVAAPSLNELCAKCEAHRQRMVQIATGNAASQRDIAEHKRMSLRRRLGLLAQ